LAWSSVRPVIELLAPEAADDPALVGALVRLVNAAYGEGERGMWVAGTERTDAGEIAEAIRGGGMLVAWVDGRIAGCSCLRTVDATAANLGFIAAAPEAWGTGLGRDLVRAAEDLARTRGVRTIQLDLLVPLDGTHPTKERLRAWYERLGYPVVGTAPFAAVAPQADPALLTAPCEFLIFRKRLG
jgi:GNAT superfamily N-acetyltransferase